MRDCIRLMSVVLALCLTAAFASAETFTLDRTLTEAVEASHALEAARAGVDSASQAAALAGAEGLPTLAATGSYGAFNGDVLFGRFIPGTPGDGTSDIGPYDGNTLLNLELKQVLYAGGAITAAKKLGLAEERAASVDLEEGIREIRYRAAEAFYRLLLAEQRREVAARSVTRSEEGLEMLRLRYEEQEALKVELLGVEGQLAADRLELQRAEGDLELALFALNRLLGREAEAPLELEGSLEDSLAVPGEAEGVERSRTEAVEIRRGEVRLETAGAALERARSLSRAKVELGLVYSWIDNELFFDGQYAGAMVSVSIPFVSDFKAGAAAKKRAEASLRQAREMQSEAVSAQWLNAVAAYNSLENGKTAVDVARRNLEYHRERYRVTLSAYREELVTYSEVLERHQELSQAELALDGAFFEVRLAEAEIARQLGSAG